jgi:hypothetical protein
LDEEGNLIPSVTANLPLKAIARIRIPLKRPAEKVEELNQDTEDNGKILSFPLTQLL